MSIVADRYAALTVGVTSPDNNLRAVLKSGQQVTVEFRPGTYRSYGERDLEHQIARLATLTLTGHHRGFTKIAEEANLTLKNGPQDATSEAERRYLRARDELTVIGATSERLVGVKATGLSDWECRIANGTLAYLSEEEFLKELHGAIASFIGRFNTKMAQLKDEYFGLDLPEDAKKVSV